MYAQIPKYHAKHNALTDYYSRCYPIKYLTRAFSCLFDGSLVDNDTESDRNQVIFLANAIEKT